MKLKKLIKILHPDTLVAIVDGDSYIKVAKISTLDKSLKKRQVDKLYSTSSDNSFELCIELKKWRKREWAMGKKYIVIESRGYDRRGLKVGDIVTKVEGSTNGSLYELPKHLHGKGYNAIVYDEHLNLKEDNYFYIPEDYLEEIKEDVKWKTHVEDSIR